MLNIDLSFLTTAVTIAVETIAIIEAIKNFISQKQKKLPAWIYTVLEFLLCFGLSLLKCDGFTFTQICAQIELGLLAVAISQLSYDSLWKAVKNAIKKQTEGLNECEN